MFPLKMDLIVKSKENNLFVARDSNMVPGPKATGDRPLGQAGLLCLFLPDPTR